MNFLVIDGNSILNRAFYGIKVLTTKDGRFTNAIYGFLNILEKMEREEQPEEREEARDFYASLLRACESAASGLDLLVLDEVLDAVNTGILPEESLLAFVKNRPDAAPWLFLVEAQKNRRTGLRIEPDVLITAGAALYGPSSEE